MKHQKTNKRIYHVPEEETKRKVEAKGCAEGQYHSTFNHELESSPHLLPSCAHGGAV